MKPDDYFQCERLSATLRVETCARRRPTHDACYKCEVGDKHVALVSPTRLVIRRFNNCSVKSRKRLAKLVEAVDGKGRKPHDTLPVGARFGRWTVLGEAEGKTYKGHHCRKNKVRCECGGESSVPTRHLLSGRSSSCRSCATRFGKFVAAQ